MPKSLATSSLANSLAFLISRIFGPLPLIFLLWLVTAFKSGIGFWNALWVYPLIFIVGIVLPFVISTYVLIKRGSTDLEWSRLEDRRILFPLALISGGLVTILSYLLTNTTIFHLTLLAGLITVLVSIISTVLNFKISIHVTIASGVFWGINFLTYFKFWWLFFVLIPIVWARYILKVHTAVEILAGLILTNSLIILAVLIFGLPKIP